MKQTILSIILALCALTGTTTTAQAAEKTVTYTFIAEYANYNVNRWTFTFTPSNSGFGYSTGAKTVTIENTSSTAGFTVELDDGLKLTYSQDEGHLTFWGSNGFYLNGPHDGGNSQLKLTSSHFYVTHVKMATTSGNALTGQASPWMTDSGQLDQDVDMVTQYEGPSNYREFSATISSVQVFGQLTVTYGDPREYAITFNDAVNGQNGVTNPTPTSYNVTTNTFDITAPSRTGYTLSGTTYTDAANPSTNHINLNMTPLRIYRGEAATRKAITLNASWTAHQYTLRLYHNDGTDDYDDVAMTYDVAHTLPALSHTGYVLSGWNTQADGNGTSYADGESIMNLTSEQGATVELYAQWANPSGTCGPSATWEYDYATRTLTIGGSGGTSSYAENNAPWQNYKSYIETVSIGSGITKINGLAFKGCTNLATVSGGSGLTSVDYAAFALTPWRDAALKSPTIVYLGHVAYIGKGVSGDVTIQDGTVSIVMYAFQNNTAITSVTIPASVTIIETNAFYGCDNLSTVNILADTPPDLDIEAFCLNSTYRSIDRTFNVRSAAYKTADGWKDIYNKENDYEGHTGTKMRVVSTLALPSGIAIVPETSDSPVTILSTDYYAEQATVTLSYTGSATLEGIKVNGSANGVTNNGNGTFTFTMPAEDVTVTRQYTPVSYIDADGDEQNCTDYILLESRDANVALGTKGETNWYVVSGDVTINGNLKFKDSHSHVIICDGATLTVNGAQGNNPLRNDNGSITFYGQTIGSGTVNVTASSSTYSGILAQNDITINGGTINATGGVGIAICNGATLTQNGGTLNATGGIGIIIMQDGTLTQNGGTLTATGSNGTGITAQSGSTVNILGGTLTATGFYEGSYEGSGITVNNSAVTLGWTTAADRITVSSYYTDNNATVRVKSGQTLYDGTTAYEGTLDADQLEAFAGKTLVPYIESTFAPDGTAILYDSDTGLPDDHKNADRIAALAADGQPHNIVISGRTLYKDGYWNTLCLPFNIENISQTPLAGAEIRSLSSASLENGTLTLNFSEPIAQNQGLTLDTPYIIKWTKADGYVDDDAHNLVNPLFPSVYVSKENHDFTSTDGTVQFKGTYTPIIFDATDKSILFMGADNTLYYPETGASIGAFRAYFELTDPSNEVRAFSLSFGEDSEAQGITTTNYTDSTDKAGAWFDLQGRRVSESGIRNSELRHGLYIHGGRKVVIK